MASTHAFWGAAILAIAYAFTKTPEMAVSCAIVLASSHICRAIEARKP